MSGYRLDQESQVDNPKLIKTLVPGGDPIELVAYYEAFEQYYVECELQTKSFFQNVIQPDWVCIDAGANVGYHSILMGRLAPLGEVHAFEPTSTYEMLLKNVTHNNAQSVRPVRMGLSNRSFSGELLLYRIWGQDPENTQCDYTTVDDYVAEKELNRVDLIKIDVDGFDLEVLWGAEKTFERFSPIVVVELNHALSTRGYTPSQAMDFMLQCRYSSVMVLDDDNYAFTKTWNIGEPWPSSLSVSFDHRNALRRLMPIPAKDVHAEISNSWQMQNGARCEEDGIMSHDAPAWHYAMTLKLPSKLPSLSAACITVEVLQGELGIFLTDETGSEILTPEFHVKSDEQSQVTLPINLENARYVVFRKVNSAVLRFRLIKADIRSIDYVPKTSRLLSQFTRVELEDLIDEDCESTWSEHPLDGIIAGSVEELAKTLCIDPPLKFNYSARFEDPANLLMERDDAPILEWLFKSLQPRRHFEFGTWEGFGSTLCLRSCNALVWTLNLPEGESESHSYTYASSRLPMHPANPLTHSQDASDAGASIGWMYRTAGYSERVTQIMADSRQFDPVSLKGVEFDTVLIDGAHDRQTVRIDQGNALKLVGPSGLVIWHDFSLDPDVVRAFKSCRGVIAAVADNISFLNETFDLWWIRDSLLLVGVPIAFSKPTSEMSPFFASEHKR
jgi:FkbM family methyltransferase